MARNGTASFKAKIKYGKDQRFTNDAIYKRIVEELCTMTKEDMYDRLNKVIEKISASYIGIQTHNSGNAQSTSLIRNDTIVLYGDSGYIETYNILTSSYDSQSYKKRKLEEGANGLFQETPDLYTMDRAIQQLATIATEFEEAEVSCGLRRDPRRQRSMDA
jgi:hypothetical protein